MKEKVISLISGGIDSPLAALRASREFEILPLHFCLYPLSSEESSQKALDSLKNLKSKIGYRKAIIFPWAGILSEIKSSVKEPYSCVCCRRGMLKVSDEIGKRESALGIVTGESLGQKASQTIENIAATSSGINLPVLRPLLGMNKEEIIALAREKDIFMEDHAGCCLATPRNPRTKAKVKEVNREMEKVEVKSLIEENEDLMLEVEDFNRDFEDYLLYLAAEFR